MLFCCCANHDGNCIQQLYSFSFDAFGNVLVQKTASCQILVIVFLLQKNILSKVNVSGRVAQKIFPPLPKNAILSQPIFALIQSFIVTSTQDEVQYRRIPRWGKKNTTISKQLLLEEKDLQALMFMQCA